MQLQHEKSIEPVQVVIAADRISARPIAEVIKALSSKDKAVRSAAETELAALGPTATEDLLRALETEGTKYRKQRAATSTTGLVIGLLVLAFVGTGVAVGVSTGNWDMLSNFASFGGVFGALGAAAAMSPQHRSIVSLMANLDDVRSVGWLVDALDTQDKTLGQGVERALVRLLPRLGPSDSALLADAQRRILDRRLVKSNSGELVMAILGVYEKVGDSKSLESVKQVAEGHIASPFDPYVRRTAMQAEDAMRARAEKEHQAHTLLRAAEDLSGPDTLLRPASGAGPAAEETLLRPMEQEKGR